MEILLQTDKLFLFLGVLLAICLLVIGAILLDLWDALYTARKTKQKIHSHKLRVTIEKLSEYFRFVALGFLVDCIGYLFSFYFLPFAAIGFGAGLIAVECKSLFEHASRRKSATQELPDIISSIIHCAREEDAKELLERLAAAGDKKEP